MSGLTLNERHQICWQESKIHGCSHAVCFLSISFEKRQQPQPPAQGGGWECSCPGVPSPCPHQLDYCWPSWNLISQPASLYSSAAPTWEAEVASSPPCWASSSNGHLTAGCGFESQGLSPGFLGKCTCPQPLKGAEPLSLGSFLTRRDVGEGAQEDWSETPPGQVMFRSHLVPSISIHTPPLGLRLAGSLLALPVWSILVQEGFALPFGVRTLVLTCPAQQCFCLYWLHPSQLGNGFVAYCLPTEP